MRAQKNRLRTPLVLTAQLLSRVWLVISQKTPEAGFSQMQFQKSLEQQKIPILHKKIPKSVVVQYKIGAPWKYNQTLFAKQTEMIRFRHFQTFAKIPEKK